MDVTAPETTARMPGDAVLRDHMMSVIIPANNEERLIGDCLLALLESEAVRVDVEIIVAANGCTDRTVAVARDHAAMAHARGWGLSVLDLPEGGKPGALNAADRVARGRFRAYLDADVTVSPMLLGELCRVLDREDPAYASGAVRITTPGSAASRHYARFWARVPFMATGVPGCGLFAVNGPGRARWDAFPAIIADDLYVRLHFKPEERHGVSATYDWPIAPDFDSLVRVRGRQDRGVRQIAEMFPALPMNEDKAPVGILGTLGMAARDPAGFAVYAAVALAVRKDRQTGTEWSRSR